MKSFTQFILFIFAFTTQAQDFKPYKIKSGKIVYEKLRYATHSEFSSINGVESSFSEQIPYIAEQIVYYWDEFGDVAFEENYKVSDFGGKPLPEKIKFSEWLWKGDHRYFFNIEKNTLSDDPFYLRIKCREIFQYYQIIGSWIKTQYMGAEASGTKEIMGKQADYLKIDESSDLYTWKDIVLKQEDFATTINGNRLYPHRTKIAVEIDTVSEVKHIIFDPVWLKREQIYQSFDRNKLDNFLDSRLKLLEQADNVKGIKIRKNDILFFVTTNYRLGKMQVLTCNADAISIKYAWYYSDNSIGSSSDSFIVNKNTFIDIDAATTVDEKSSEVEFRVECTKEAVLLPQNNIGIYLLKASRTNDF